MISTSDIQTRCVPAAATKGKKRKRVERPVEAGTNSGHWSKEEQKTFLDGIEQYGHDWNKIAQHIKTRSATQVRSHYQKYAEANKKNKTSDQRFNYLRQRSIEVQKSIKEGSRQFEESIIIDPELKKALFKVLKPYSIDGQIVLCKELLVYAMHELCKPDAGKEPSACNSTPIQSVQVRLEDLSPLPINGGRFPEESVIEN